MAIDIINAKHNEGLGSIWNKDLSVVFVGKCQPNVLSLSNLRLYSVSGNLRNVVKTVNGLPEDYTSTLKVVLNDFNPIVVCQNIMVLTILGKIPDIMSINNYLVLLR